MDSKSSAKEVEAARGNITAAPLVEIDPHTRAPAVGSVRDK